MRARKYPWFADPVMLETADPLLRSLSNKETMMVFRFCFEELVKLGAGEFGGLIGVIDSFVDGKISWASVHLAVDVDINFALSAMKNINTYSSPSSVSKIVDLVNTKSLIMRSIKTFASHYTTDSKEMDIILVEKMIWWIEKFGDLCAMLRSDDDFKLLILKKLFNYMWEIKHVDQIIENSLLG